MDEKGPYTGSRKVHNPKPGGYQYDVTHERTGKTCVRPANGYRYPEHRMKELIAEKRILFGDDDTQIVQIKEYLEEYEGKLASVVVLDSRAGANELEGLFGERKVFTNPKPVSLLSDIFGYCLEPGDVALDFFAGSGTTAQAVVELNVFDGGARRFILVHAARSGRRKAGLLDHCPDHPRAGASCRHQDQEGTAGGGFATRLVLGWCREGDD